MLDFMTTIDYTPVSEWFDFEESVKRLAIPVAERVSAPCTPSTPGWQLLGDCDKHETITTQTIAELRMVMHNRHNYNSTELSEVVPKLMRHKDGVGTVYDVGHIGVNNKEHKRDVAAVLDYELLNGGTKRKFKIMAGRGKCVAKKTIQQMLDSFDKHYPIHSVFDKKNTTFTVTF